MARKADPLKALEQTLGLKFESRDLIERALTHASVRGGAKQRPDNERLEFIGDRVLALAIASHLHEVLPMAREGELARTFNRLVRKETCAAVARSLDVGKCLILSDSEADSGGRDKDTILADAMEAILAAIFIEKGYDAARDVVIALWQDHIGEVPKLTVDPKSALQEWVQGKGLALPQYDEASRTGPDHAPRFVAKVTVAGRLTATGTGASKRQAEQAAAQAMLIEQGVWSKSKRG